MIGGFVGASIQYATSQNIYDPARRRQWEAEEERERQREEEEAAERHRQREAEEERELQREQEEVAERRRQREAERPRWEKEQEEAEERRRQWEAEEEAMQRAQIHRLALESSQHCEWYGTRKYWAKMGPLVGGYDPMKACWTSEIEIHGRKMKPTYCEDKGCTAPGSGLRRFDAHLMNLDYADGWNVMFSSTPANFNGLHFNGAMSCVNSYFGGVFGIWDIVDGDCL
ncbi:uncharacterized protein LACBIDRAFT_329727 [Laccaria bicolor S238N-H82]|uniref:Predicted protein n=1 Tax=Laccaria bicolor (strain S238N-H82 / ATCC MYA-4686) TaxID=486041 RepID=B0DJ15_LACBS|nr:uncharacterized protein LACBIDRAFT_329727 [Laccaria bicolor S238N-H82]EDR05326.1 predicted protein [Laccaria bicolor S238N-H82]|eukprot:XP_001883884.1 predicted protein [Laccaria bicolor S238N-H82]